MTDFRARCAELVSHLQEARDAVQGWADYANDYFKQKHDLDGELARIQRQIDCVRAELAQPELEGPTDDDLKNAVREALKDYKYSTKIPYFLDGTEEEPMMLALRAVCSLGRHAAPLPTVLPEGSGARLIRRALELWGHPAIKPVPVAERLPGAEDCDAEGRCWWSYDSSCDDPFRDGSPPNDPSWFLRKDGPESPNWIHRIRWHIPCVHPTHWLPHHALPVPISQETP